MTFPASWSRCSSYNHALSGSWKVLFFNWLPSFFPHVYLKAKWYTATRPGSKTVNVLVVQPLHPNSPSAFVPALCPQSLSLWLHYSKLVLIFLVFPFLAFIKWTLTKRGLTNIEDKHISCPLAQTRALFLFVYVFVWFGFSNNYLGLIWASSLILPKAIIFKLYINLDPFFLSVGSLPALTQPDTDARASMLSHPVGEEPHGTGCLLIPSL